MKMSKRILAFLLAAVMTIGLLPVSALAAEEYTGIGTFKQATGALTSGYYVFGVGDSVESISAVNTTAASNWLKFAVTTSTSGAITNPGSSIVWYYDAEAGTFNNGTNYVAWPITGNSAGLKTTGTPLTVAETATAGVYNITVTATPGRMLRLNGSSGYRFYTSGTGTNTFYFFKLEENAGGCAHTNQVAVGEAKTPSCTETGMTAGIKCADCDVVLVEQEELPMVDHTYVDGVCSVCGAAQPKTLTINRDAFGDASGYAWHDWTATTTTGESISGSGFIYGNATASIQMNGSKDGDYIYNTTALPGNIISVTLTKASGTDRNFDVLTAGEAFDSADPLKGQATDAKKKVTTEGVTWTFETDHKYFAIVLCDSSAAYLSSIEVVYAAACAHANKVAIGEAKAATCTEDGITAGEKCADCGEVLAEQEVLESLGHIDDDNNGYCDREDCNELMCTDHVWVGGDILDEPTCTATGRQAQVCQKCGQPGEDKVLDKVAHTPVTDEAVAATCTATGLTEGSHCSVCEEVLVAQTVVDMIAHNYVDGTCSACGDIIVPGAQLAEFQFGDNGDAAHKDGSGVEAGVVFTAGGQKLTLDAATKVYDGAFDAMGNSALKLGTGSGAASFSFTVANNVKSVVIYIAGYKANAAKIDVNGKEYEITSKSNEGAYTKIVVSTAETKTVTLTTLSGGYRAMIDSVELWGEKVGEIGGYTATLGDNIGVNFYMDLPEATLNDATAYMLITLPNGTTEEVAVDPSKTIEYEGKTYYAFTGYIAAKEMTQMVTAQLITANGVTGEYTYNVQTYAKSIIDGSTYTDKEKNLAKAMLNYGAYAQVMFGHEIENLANSVLGEADRNVADVTISDEYKKSYTANIDGVQFRGTTTLWEADTTIRHYFTITGENVTFQLQTAAGTKDLEVKNGQYGKYVAIEGIAAKDMATAYTIIISNGTDSQTITSSVYSYFYDILNGSSYSEAEKNAAQAAYLYGEAAAAYFE